ncbi:adenylate kinase family protein [Candidatus Woesearchaeota archaeon]|nr:adenylate kinase family protein [Candidatus Woesearchaeota archaeon]
MKTLVVTGTPGAGKTVLAKKLSLLLDYAYFDVNSFVKRAHLYSSYDRKRQSYVVDEAKLARELAKVRGKALKSSQKGIIFDSHLSHFLPPRLVNLCIVARCSPQLLRQRLAKRGYPEAKIRENLEAEIFEVCLSEARDAGHEIVLFDTSKATTAAVNALAARIRKSVRT